MSIDEKMLAELAVVNLNFKIVCDLFGLSESERLHPNAGQWIVDCIKQYQTSYTALRSAKMRLNENQSVAGYAPTPQLPANPLLATTGGDSNGG